MSKSPVNDAWKKVYFHEVCDVNPTYKIANGETCSFIDMASVAADSPEPRNIEIRDYQKTSASKFKNGDVLFARITPCTENGKTALVRGLTTEFGFGSTEFIVLSPKDELDSKFLYYVVKDGNVRNKAIARMVGTTGRQRVPNEFFRDELEVSLPPLAEQRKIVAILTSVDETIAATQRVIDQTEVVKRGLMQQLLAKGISHTTFKQTEIGEIPMAWDVVPLSKVMNLVERPMKMEDEKEYQLVTVKRRHGGVVPRGRLLGRNILVKSQFYIREGDFLISKRQIVHGACEVVPKELDGAIVSNEYHALLVDASVDMDYFRWFCRTPMMMKYFLVSSIGVHIEKMLFKLDDWLKRMIPLPSIEEQREIARVLTSLERSIRSKQEYLEKLTHLKTGLMQVLLTGKIRANVDEPSEVSV